MPLRELPEQQGEDEDSDTAAFKREALGRRSMSEKRKGHLDPKLSEFYQKIKENREKKTYYAGTLQCRCEYMSQSKGTNCI